MTRITENSIDPGQDQGKITFLTQGVVRGQFVGTGTDLDANGFTIRAMAGATYSVTSATAASATPGASGLSGTLIAHGLGATPTTFGVTPANTQAAISSLLGYSVSADATNITISHVSAFTANKPYAWQWFAAP